MRQKRLRTSGLEDKSSVSGSSDGRLVRASSSGAADSGLITSRVYLTISARGTILFLFVFFVTSIATFL